MKKSRVVIGAVALVLIMLTLIACVPSREACKTKYENAGYKTTPLSANTLELSGEDVDYIYCATKEASGDYIRVVVFKKKDKATEYSERAKIENEGEGGYIVEQKGKVILVGTQNALDIYNNKGGIVSDDGSESSAE